MKIKKIEKSTIRGKLHPSLNYLIIFEIEINYEEYTLKMKEIMLVWGKGILASQRRVGF